jgi:hypothetical protein
MYLTDREKAVWLHNNWKPYTIDWYLEDSKRLAALYKIHYHEFLNKQWQETVAQKKAEMDAAANEVFGLTGKSIKDMTPEERTEYLNTYVFI